MLYVALILLNDITLDTGCHLAFNVVFELFNDCIRLQFDSPTLSLNAAVGDGPS